MFQLVCANRRSIPYTYVISNNIGIVAALLLLATVPIAEGFPQAFAYSGGHRDGYYGHHGGADRRISSHNGGTGSSNIGSRNIGSSNIGSSNTGTHSGGPGGADG
jgi:hypothetical protein